LFGTELKENFSIETAVEFGRFIKKEWRVEFVSGGDQGYQAGLQSLAGQVIQRK